jgi:hypothetical protein
MSNVAPTEVPLVPAPWSLRGHAWIVVLRLPREAGARHAWVPAGQRSTLVAPLSCLMFVDYAASPCGPYREILFVPGAMRFPDGRLHASISRILVSTWDSVVNGRRNWGIPKDRADFEIVRTAERDRLSVAQAGAEICRLEFEPPAGVRLPLSTSWLPERWLTLAQLHEGRAYYYRPEARGSLRTCRLLHWQFDPLRFPDLNLATVIASLRIEDFRMEFPVARVEGPSGGGAVDAVPTGRS